MAAAAALAATGCRSDSGGNEAGGAQGDARTSETAPEATLAEKPPTKVEVRWVGKLVDWSLSLAEPLETGVAAGEMLQNGERLSAADAALVADALNSVVACSETFERVAGEPPGSRLEDVATSVREACKSLEAGAEVGLRVLGRAPEPALVDEWSDEWERGSELLSTAAEAVIDYQPSNARPIPVRKGRVGVTRIEPVFSEVASSLVEEDVEARCWARADWPRLMREMKSFSNGRTRAGTLGFAGYGDRRVNPAPPVCEALVALRYDRARPPAGEAHLALALAVGTLTHEAQHARGVANEARAECYGMQLVRTAARALGAEGAYASSLAGVYWRVIYPAAPRPYRSPECRNRGRLDLEAKSSVWP